MTLKLFRLPLIGWFWYPTHQRNFLVLQVAWGGPQGGKRFADGLTDSGSRSGGAGGDTL